MPWTSKKKVSVSEPPLTSHLTVAQLEELAATSSSELVLTAIPCHSQAVERHVRMVSNASKRVVGEQKRHENILGTLESRSQMPSFRTKRDFEYTWYARQHIVIEVIGHRESNYMLRPNNPLY